MQEKQVQSLGQEDQEEEMAIHSSILAWTEEPGRLQSIGSQKSQTRLSNFLKKQKNSGTIILSCGNTTIVYFR